jgi:thioredoxin-related protein
MKRLILAIAVVSMALPTAALAAGEGWYDDFDGAVKAAKAEGKDLLVDFSGSDWCGWCIKLDKEVFQHESFTTAAKEQYVLVVLDFPRGEAAKAKVPNPARNQELQAKYGIRGFPTVLLMNADGHVYARTGYQAGGPEAYVKHLAEIREKFRPGLASALEAVKAVEAAEGDARAAAIEAALKMLEGLEGAPYASALVPAAKAAIASDADNAGGLKLRAVKLLMDKGLADDEVLSTAGAMDPENEHGLLEKVMVAKMGKVRSKEAALEMLPKIEDFLANHEIKDKDAAIGMRANAAFWNWRFAGNPEKAKAHAAELEKLNPENPRIKQLIKQIQDS